MLPQLATLIDDEENELPLYMMSVAELSGSDLAGIVTVAPFANIGSMITYGYRGYEFSEVYIRRSQQEHHWMVYHDQSLWNQVWINHCLGQIEFT